MNFLIVHAHPEPQSFNTAMALSAQRILTEQGHTVDTSDLYAMGFNPVASRDDFLLPKTPTYMNYALEQRHATQTSGFAADIAQELDKLQRADFLLLVFPMYWCSVPAIMKGWIDRVLVSGVCYGGKRFYDKGGLKGKFGMVALTVGAQPHMFVENGIHGDIQSMLKPIQQGTLAYIGLEVLEPYVAYHVPYLPEEERNQIMQDWEAAVRRLALRPRVPMPSLEHFDERLHPLPRG